MLHSSFVTLEWWFFLGMLALCFLTFVIRVIGGVFRTGLPISVIFVIISIACSFLIMEIGFDKPVIHLTPGPSGGGEEVEVDVFFLFYLFVPFLFSLWLFSFGITESTLGCFSIAKGVFYIILSFISTVEYIFVEDANLAKLALGFTLSLAVFESIAAIIDGVKKILSEE